MSNMEKDIRKKVRVQKVQEKVLEEHPFAEEKSKQVIFWLINLVEPKNYVKTYKQVRNLKAWRKNFLLVQVKKKVAI